MYVVKNPFTAILIAVFALLLASGCKDTGTDVPDTSPNFRLSLQAAGSVLEKPTHEILHITSVKVLVRGFALTAEGSSDSSQLETGSRVVDLDMRTRLTELISVRIPAGQYKILRCALHPFEHGDALPDSVFHDPSGSPIGYSVVVEGFYHETPFVFKSRISSSQELHCLVTVTVPERGTLNLTMRIDPYAWFTEGVLIFDPFNQVDVINEHINASFADLYPDNNRDGNPD